MRSVSSYFIQTSHPSLFLCPRTSWYTGSSERVLVSTYTVCIQTSMRGEHSGSEARYGDGAHNMCSKAMSADNCDITTYEPSFLLSFSAIFLLYCTGPYFSIFRSRLQLCSARLCSFCSSLPSVFALFLFRLLRFIFSETSSLSGLVLVCS